MVHDNIANDTTRIKGRELINYTSYNYLGFSGDPRVSEISKESINKYGTSVSASRTIAGERSIHQDLEQEIAEFLGVDSSVVVVSGYTTNFTTIGHLFHRKDLILYDESSHNSIIQGAYLSRAKMMPFLHNDPDDLQRLLEAQREKYRKTLIVTEGVFSIDGDIPELPRLIELKKKHRAALMIDEAHSLGVIGKKGRGITEYWGVDPRAVDILMGTLSKSLASCGGYIAGSSPLIRYLKYTMPGFMFSVGLTPANTGAALGALRLMQKSPERLVKLQENAHFFKEQARKLGLCTGNSKDSGVIPIMIGTSVKAMKMTNYLYEHGINVSPMIAPAVPEGEATLRFFIVTDHSEQQMIQTLEKVKQGLELHCS
jgi:8-amino-7-oxononanoate synthase